jgi:hypothetical protein
MIVHCCQLDLPMEIMRIVQATMEENAKKRGSTTQNDHEDTFKRKD